MNIQEFYAVMDSTGIVYSKKSFVSQGNVVGVAKITGTAKTLGGCLCSDAFDDAESVQAEVAMRQLEVGLEYVFTL